MKPLIDLHGEPRNWATSAPLYIEALADIPPKILAIAVKHAITSNPYFPKPAELRASVVDELSNYRRKQDEERQAALPPPPDLPAPSQEDIDYVDRIVAKALQGIAGRRSEIQGTNK